MAAECVQPALRASQSLSQFFLKKHLPQKLTHENPTQITTAQKTFQEVSPECSVASLRSSDFFQSKSKPVAKKKHKASLELGKSARLLESASEKPPVKTASNWSGHDMVFEVPLRNKCSFKKLQIVKHSHSMQQTITSVQSSVEKNLFI